MKADVLYPLNPCKFYKSLADDTRLSSLMLMAKVGELCVCDIMEALDLDQPKISRHLAELRKNGIVQDDRRGKWVYYRLHPNLPEWASQVIMSTAQANPEYYADALARLEASKADGNICY